jgi:hypothetical protein
VSTAAAPPALAPPGTDAEDTGLARPLLLLGAVAVLLSLLLGWDGGIRDQLTAEQVRTTRRNGLLSAFDTEPSTPFALLFPFGVALLGVASLMLAAAARGVAGRGVAVALGGALVCVVSLVLRGLLDAAPGVPDGSLLALGGLLVATSAVMRLPQGPVRAPGPVVLALGLVSAALLTGMVHDAYAVVDADEAVLGGYGVGDDASWPQTWLAAPVGARTLVDVALVLVASCGLLAATLAAVGRLERPAATGLAVLAGVTLLGLLVLAIGPNPGVSGVDRFPAALGAVAALLAILPLARRAAEAPPPPPEEPPEPVAALREPEELQRVAPPEAWAHPSKRPTGWWS